MKVRYFLFIFLIMFFFTSQVYAGVEDISFNTDIVKVVVPRGQTHTAEFNFFNNGEMIILNLEKNSIFDFFTVPEAVEVGSNISGHFNIVFNSGLPAGVYVGVINISDYTGASNEILVIFENEDAGRTFDLAFSEGPELLNVPLGTFDLGVTVFNVNSQNTEAFFEIKVLLKNGLELEEESRIVYVNRELTFNENIQTAELESGETYVVIGSATNQGVKGTSSLIFTVAGANLSPIDNIIDYSNYILFFVIGFLIIFAIFLSYYWNRRTLMEAKDWRSQIGEIKKAKFGDSARTLRKLNMKKSTLGRAYSEHYITRESYSQGIREMNKLIERVKKKL
ncbi:MAG: hypothetical protein Q8P57_03305 [Candidatus Pacearchaeota archaeon]|nr:hypothetical protein [Candidatus Pacearchaeota archaeon]